MNQAELLLSYTTKGKNIKRVRVPSRKYPFLLGNSRRAHVTLNDVEVSPLHTAIEYRNGAWYLLDLASETGTWIDNEIIAEHKIDKPMTFRVGSYEIKVEPRTEFSILYNSLDEKPEGSDLHEIIIRNKKGIVNTFLLPKNKSFQFGERTFAPPKVGAWESNQVDNVIVLQRLVKAPHELAKTKVQENLTSKKHIFGVLGVLALIFAIIVFFPRAPKDESEVKKLNTNRYTQLVFDSKLIQKKREEAMKIAKETFKAPVPSTKESSGVSDSRKQAQAAPKVISNIKASGLQQLLGKIAQRQNINNKNTIFSNGTTDYSKGTGAAIGGAKMPTVSGVSGGISNNEKGFKLSSIGTKGVGGGGNVTGYGTLKGGGVGSADVGAVEEEAEIGTGLDRDAVAAVIRANIGQVRYCYERKLIANPNLFGKILVQFSIEGKGVVQRPKVIKTTLSDADVEGCILRRLSQWKFPTPPAGTSVLVTYPFLFKSTQ